MVSSSSAMPEHLAEREQNYLIRFAHPVGDTFADHDAREISIGAHDVRHHGRIDDTQSLDASHAAILIDDGGRIAFWTHLRGADWMKNRRATLADDSLERGIGVHDFRREVH